MLARLFVSASTIGVALAGLMATPLRAQRILPADSVIRGILEERVAQKRTVGIAVGTLDPDGTTRIVSAGASGQPGLAVDGDAVFEIGSITKTFTAALLSDMMARGEVRLDDPVAKYLPASVKMPARGGKQITLLDLATQSSGLRGMPTNFAPKDMSNPYVDYTVQQMYDFLSGYELPRDIGVQYEYSNLGVGLLGHALALKSGKTYEAILTERILAPLGMRDTRITLNDDMRRRLALGHDEQGKIVANWDLPTLAGAGALRSTVKDMLKYLAANLDATSRPLGKQLAVTHESRREAGSPTMTIGLAWHILKGPGGSIVWHNGGTGGYRTFIGFDLVKRAGVVVLTNSAIGADDIGFHLIDGGIPLTKPPAAHTEVAIDAAKFTAYVGVYELAPNFSITVSVDGQELWLQATGQGKLRGFPESETDFFIKEADVQLTFVKGSDGQVTGLVLHQSGQDAPGKKVK